MLNPRPKAKDDRLIDGYEAQEHGPVNISGLAHSMIEHLLGCENEGVDPSDDVGLSLLVHQAYSLTRSRQFHERIDSPPSYRLTVEGLIERCHHLFEIGLGTEGVYNDLVVDLWMSILYYGTRAHLYDHSMNNEYRDDTAIAKAVYDARRLVAHH